jgi:hypothetical protein
MSGFVSIPGVVLAPDERVLDDRTFSTSNVLFYLHLRFATTDRRIVGRKPNTMLGFIPIGSTVVTYPLANVAGIRIRTRVMTAAFLLGVIFVLGGLLLVARSPGSTVVLVVLGALLMFASLRTEIAVSNSGGQTIGHDVAIWDRSAAALLIQGVGTVLATLREPNAPQGEVRDRLARLGQLRDED